MLGMKTARAVELAAENWGELAQDSRRELSDLSNQVRAMTQYGPYIVVGIGVIAVVALVLGLVAVSRD